MESEMNYEAKVVIVAGGTGALGRAVSLAFLESGASVVATYRRKDEYDALVAAAGENAARLSGATVDVTDDPATQAFAAATAAKHGRIDALVNAVGGYAGGKNLWESDAKVYDQMMALNLKSGYVLARAILPVMIRQNHGWVVNVASKAGYGHSAAAALYAASKAGALALFDSLADEVKPYNINVNSVVPSIMDTEANRAAMPKADFSKWPKTEEVARVILFLCSDDAKLVHGAAVPVFGRT
jgi:NAD(P)-dependent dehydrogenase (short-subunit alcohol dehydrogenase family)